MYTFHLSYALSCAVELVSIYTRITNYYYFSTLQQNENNLLTALKCYCTYMVSIGHLSSDVGRLMFYSVVFSIAVVKFIEVNCLYDVLLFLHNHNCIMLCSEFPNNNHNNKVYTPLSERCSQSRVYISQCHMNHILQYYAYY